MDSRAHTSTNETTPNLTFSIDDLISFAELAKRIPSRRGGRPVHVSSLHRYRKLGLRGRLLPGIRIGATWYTTMQAFQAFCAEGAEVVDPIPTEMDASTRSLDAAGW